MTMTPPAATATNHNGHDLPPLAAYPHHYYGFDDANGNQLLQTVPQLRRTLYALFARFDDAGARHLLSQLSPPVRDLIRPWDDVLFLAMLSVPTDAERHAALERLARLLVDLDVDAYAPDEFGVDALMRIHRLAIHQPLLAHALLAIIPVRPSSSSSHHLFMMRTIHAARVRYMKPEDMGMILAADSHPDALRFYLAALLAPDHHWNLPRFVPTRMAVLRTILRHCEGTDVVSGPLQRCGNGNTALHLVVFLALGPWRRMGNAYRMLQILSHMDMARTTTLPKKPAEEAEGAAQGWERDETLLAPVVRLLLDHGADPLRPNSAGESPLALYERCTSVTEAEHLMADNDNAGGGPATTVFPNLFRDSLRSHADRTLALMMGITDPGNRGGEEGGTPLLLRCLDVQVFREHIMPHIGYPVPKSETEEESYGDRLERVLLAWDNVVVDHPRYYHPPVLPRADDDGGITMGGVRHHEDLTGLVELFDECQERRPRITPRLRAEFRFRRLLVDGGVRYLNELLRARRGIMRNPWFARFPFKRKGGLNAAARMCVRQRLPLLMPPPSPLLSHSAKKK